MRARRHLVAAALLSGASLAAASTLSANLPGELTQGGQPGVDWLRTEGRLPLNGDDVSYVFYVDPRHPSFYRITRFQVTTVRAGSDGAVRTVGVEVLIWNEHPGVREPLHCYVLGPPGAGADHWRSVPAGTPQYRTALFTAMSLYAEHNARSHREGETP